MKQKLMKSVKGFTLIELMIVVAIIGILAAIAIPKFADLVTKSKESAAKGNLGALRSAVSIYYSDTEGYFPTTVSTGLTQNSKYLQSVPMTQVPRAGTANPGHPNANGVQDANNVATAPGEWNTAGTGDAYWYSGTLAGHVAINCAHTDTRASTWSTW